jgi:hypothetical protein
MMQAIKNIIMGMGDGNCGAFVELGWWLGVMVVVVFIATVAALNFRENYWLIKRKDY